MSNSSDGYTIEEAKEDIGILRRVTDDVVKAIENAEKLEEFNSGVFEGFDLGASDD